jgi:hypothetical protein
VVRLLLDYAATLLARESRRRRLRTIAAVAEVVAVAGTALAGLCLGGARDYLGTFGGCATRRGEAIRQVRLYTPMLLWLPAAG